MNPEPCPFQASALQALSLSDIKEGIGWNVKQAEDLQQELAQRRAPLTQESAKAQALQDKEAPLADIIEEETIRLWYQSCHNYIYGRPEIKSVQVDQMSFCSAVETQQSNIQEMPLPQHPTSCLEELQREAFNALPGTVNARWVAGVAHTSIDCYRVFWS